jgi:hypothetical protein
MAGLDGDKYTVEAGEANMENKEVWLTSNLGTVFLTRESVLLNAKALEAIDTSLFQCGRLQGTKEKEVDENKMPYLY